MKEILVYFLPVMSAALLLPVILKSGSSVWVAVATIMFSGIVGLFIDWLLDDEKTESTPEYGTLDWHFYFIRKTAFRGRIEEGKNTVKIKLPDQDSINHIHDLMRYFGVLGVDYQFEKLGLFECWFPRYQSVRIHPW